MRVCGVVSLLAFSLGWLKLACPSLMTRDKAIYCQLLTPGYARATRWLKRYSKVPVYLTKHHMDEELHMGAQHHLKASPSTGTGAQMSSRAQRPAASIRFHRRIPCWPKKGPTSVMNVRNLFAG